MQISTTKFTVHQCDRMCVVIRWIVVPMLITLIRDIWNIQHSFIIIILRVRAVNSLEKQKNLDAYIPRLYTEIWNSSICIWKSNIQTTVLG